MALRKAARPRSASGKLETFPRGSILNELRESTAKTEASFQRAQTSIGGSRLQAVSPVSLRSFSEEAREESSWLPEWLVKELLKGQQRSHSIGLLENILEHEGFRRHIDSAKSLRKGKNEQINLVLLFPSQAVDTSITQLVFLRTRAVKFESTAASLISNGPQGSVNFWSLFSGIPLTASFIPSRVKSHISSIAVTADDSFIYAADDDGYVYVYSIKDYALQDPEREPPKYVNHWRAHVNIVVSVEVVDEEKVLLSSSIDCTVRLWSLDGEYIGTFGQAEPWEISTPASWKHPRVPYEILIDPQSMPIHPMLEGEPPVLQLINTEPSNVTLENSLSKHEVSYNPKLPQVTNPDLDIKEEINQQSYAQALGKRLKQEHYKKIKRPLAPGGQSTYHIINSYEVVIAPPICEKPDLSVLGTDYFYEESLGED
ncbi:uncharacterized protein LOC135977562 [Chrysemys picta bellii]|uniref:uncharacterized protein LOC135977562 n=1 Tax=Chrysemys picta bellii TaxID=8478 RepID=UPI0032B2AE71